MFSQMSTQMTTTTTTTIASNVSLILQALLQLRYGQEAAFTLDEVTSIEHCKCWLNLFQLDTISSNGGGACTLDPYEVDGCDESASDANHIRRATRNALVCNRWLWRDGIIPYSNQLASAGHHRSTRVRDATHREQQLCSISTHCQRRRWT